MSLKAFHIVFIMASVLLALGLGVRCLQEYLHEDARMQLVWGLLSFGAAVLLVVYGSRFLKKFKDVSYL